MLDEIFGKAQPEKQTATGQPNALDQLATPGGLVEQLILAQSVKQANINPLGPQTLPKSASTATSLNGGPVQSEATAVVTLTEAGDPSDAKKFKILKTSTISTRNQKMKYKVLKQETANKIPKVKKSLIDKEIQKIRSIQAGHPRIT